jgi:hypothetical protein
LTAIVLVAVFDYWNLAHFAWQAITKWTDDL